jgi:xanthine dehydrogenase YagS FAD-binding subunit
MNAFEFASPTSVADALKALAGKDNSAILAGGTDLLDRIKDGLAHPDRVVYVREIKDLAGITSGRDGVTIGAATRLADLVNDKTIAEKYPALRQAALEVGTPQIRNMATVGGNLMQRPRDWYYRNGFGLLGGRNPDNNMIARDLGDRFAPINVEANTHLLRNGDNRYAAIFLTDGNALFVNTSSLAPPLIALGAKATIAGAGGERQAEIATLYQVPQETGQTELTLKPGEIITKVTIPADPGKNASYEVRHKQAHDWPVVLCSVCLKMDGEKVGSAAVVLGSVAPIPYRSQAAERALKGQALTRETAEAAAKAAVADARPLSMNAYKVRIAQVAIRRALLAAAGTPAEEA